MVGTLSHDPLWPRAGDWPTVRERASHKADMAILGVPAHATSLSPTNAHLTPAAVREALRRYSPALIADPGNSSDAKAGSLELEIVDCGDVTDPDGEAGEARTHSHVAAALDFAHVVGLLGGDNSVTVAGALGAWGTELSSAGLITFDAHFDLREGISNGSPVRRLIEAGLDPKRVVQIGIADFANSAPYAERAASWGISVVHRNEFHRRSPEQIIEDALEIAGSAGGPIHLDIDVDVCDRAVAPACPASVPGGLQAWELRSLVRATLRDQRVRSFDITEVDASADTPDQRTVRLAALCILEAAAGMSTRK